jgi:hypothetical protein
VHVSGMWDLMKGCWVWVPGLRPSCHRIQIDQTLLFSRISLTVIYGLDESHVRSFAIFASLHVFGGGADVKCEEIMADNLRIFSFGKYEGLREDRDICCDMFKTPRITQKPKSTKHTWCCCYRYRCWAITRQQPRRKQDSATATCTTNNTTAETTTAAAAAAATTTPVTTKTTTAAAARTTATTTKIPAA